MSALRNLQEKMQKLEFDRREAENNLHTLTSETEMYKTSLRHSHHHHHHVDPFLPARQDVEAEEKGPSLSSSGNSRKQPPRGESYCGGEDLAGWVRLRGVI